MRKRRFLSFPWQIYRGDPLWVPPIFSEREKATDPQRGLFFRNGYADFFIAYQDGVSRAPCAAPMSTPGIRGSAAGILRMRR